MLEIIYGTERAIAKFMSQCQAVHSAMPIPRINAGNISDAKVLVQRRLIRESIAGEGRYNDVVRERLGAIAILENGEDL